MPDDAPDHIKPYLDEIAGRLWSNNATVIVGAGFSRNAKPVDSTSPSFPSWQELGDIFYRKLHGHPPGGDARYMSLLKLAEQIQAALGRPALDDLLRRSIPNLGYEPSPLHARLLDLPWKDVFTTNYDTLLERARASVTLKHYDVVFTDEDLLYANQPRIVKLHGSFPSPPFVITEEDYRRYPSDHAPFVNTVRQSLLENTLCLIGFSGDDPNFLQWIGWIRDQVGTEAAPKIFLVGVFETLSEAEKKLLDRRGIVAVDLSGFSTDPGEASGAFLDYLRRSKTRATDWPTVSPVARSWATEADSGKYLEITAEWRRQRSEYPGWVVIPEDRRQFLWFHTENWLAHISEVSPTDRTSLNTPLDLDLAYELAWRLERCLFPLTDGLAEFLEDVASKYSDETLLLPAESGWTTTSVAQAVAHARLWLMQHYREEGLVAQWQEVRQAIKVDFGRLLPEQRARFLLEEALHALFRFNPAEARQLLMDWRSNETLPFWEAKRAALMAELGEATAARSILESSLSAIRQQLSLKPVIDDYTLISQESVVMLLLWEVEHGQALRKPDSEDGGLLEELSERWNDLARYKCDPRREIASLSARLRHRSEGRGEETRTHSFDLGMFSRTIHLRSDEEVVAAYGLLRMYEDIGMPYRMEHATFLRGQIESTLLRVRPYSPHWALATIVRLGDAKAADGLFDREFLARLNREEVDGLLEIYMPAFEHTIAMVNEPNWSDARIFESLAKTLPEVFSRLCYKCSPEYRERLVGALRSIYGSKRRSIFKGVNRFADRLFDSMSTGERARVAPSLIDFSMPDGPNENEKREFVNPLLLVDQNVLVRGEPLPAEAQKIDELLHELSQVAQSRDWTETTLVWLYDRGKLNDRQSKRLGELLWDGFEAQGVPIVTGFYSFKCKMLPHPAAIDPEPRVKERLRAQIDEVMGDSRLDHTLDELSGSANRIQWSKAEAMEFVVKLSGWWDRNHYLLHYRMSMPFGSPADNTRRTIRKAVLALSNVISQIQTDNDNVENIDSLREFLVDLATRHIPARVLEAAALNIAVGEREHVTRNVAAALLHRDHDVVVDALIATRILARLSVGEATRRDFMPVATMLVQGVQWRHRPALSDRLRIVAELVRHYTLLIPTEALACLLDGVEEIAGETSKGIRGNDENGVISVRAAAASLAFALFEHYRASESAIPKAIRGWQEITRNPDEFSEVRNSWG